MEVPSTHSRHAAHGTPRRRDMAGWAFPLGVATLLAAWTLLAWLSWLLVGIGGQWLEAASGWLAASPETLYWARAAVRFLESSGAVLIAILWMMGAVGIVAGAWISRLLWRGAQRALASAAPIDGGEFTADAAEAREAAHPALPDGRRPSDG
jgi:hypothetical protein